MKLTPKSMLARTFFCLKLYKIAVPNEICKHNLIHKNSVFFSVSERLQLGVCYAIYVIENISSDSKSFAKIKGTPFSV